MNTGTNLVLSSPQTTDATFKCTGNAVVTGASARTFEDAATGTSLLLLLRVALLTAGNLHGVSTVVLRPLY